VAAVQAQVRAAQQVRQLTVVARVLLVMSLEQRVAQTPAAAEVAVVGVHLTQTLPHLVQAALAVPA
jgi:hypothetical protein